MAELTTNCGKLPDKIKTIKEIREKVYSQCKDESEKRLLEHLFRLEDEEAVKWVKEDWEWMDKGEILDLEISLRLLELRWIYRLNLTEEEIGEEK